MSRVCSGVGMKARLCGAEIGSSDVADVTVCFWASVIVYPLTCELDISGAGQFEHMNWLLSVGDVFTPDGVEAVHRTSMGK